MQLTADEKQVRLRQVLDRSTDPAPGDPHRLQQIVWNLLSNAIKFTPAGGELALTGYAALQEAERALSAGYQSHLSKPIEPSRLVRVIASFGLECGNGS